jgi:hypothetical protein
MHFDSGAELHRAYTRTRLATRSPTGATPRRAGGDLAARSGADRDGASEDGIVANGRDAADAFAGSDVAVRAVRHPSHGGQTEFVAGMCDLYGIIKA